MKKNSISSKYLAKYDLLNQYLITNLDRCPEIEEVTIKLSHETFASNMRVGGVLSPDAEANKQVKGILFLYILAGMNSIISYKNAKNEIDHFSKEDIHSYFVQKVVMENKLNIQYFLDALFTNTDFRSIADLKPLKKSKDGASRMSLTIKMPVSASNDLTEFCNFSAKDIADKDSRIIFHCILRNCQPFKDGPTNSTTPLSLLK